MIGTEDPTALLLLAAGLLFTGAVAGILAGLLGVGGGIVIVPVLFHIFSGLEIDPAVKMHLAVGTSLATIIPTSIVSARSHYKRGSVDFDLFRRWAPFILIGTLIGSLIAVYVKGPVLTAVFAVIALCVAIHMAAAKEGFRIADALPKGLAEKPIPTFIGGFSAMMGIGGGTLSVPTLTACNYPIRNAVGTAAAIGLLIAVPGTIAFIASGIDVPGRPPYSIGYMSLIGFALIVPTTMLCAPLGAKIAHTIKPRALRLAFAVFLGFTSIRMFYSLLA